MEQALKLSTWREAAVVIVYEPDAFRAFSLDDVLSAHGELANARSTPLDTYINDVYLACIVGDDELDYDARRRILSWRAMNGEIVGTRFAASHRIAVAIAATDVAPHRIVDRFVDPDEVGLYRMYATDAEVLAPSGIDSLPPQQARRALLPIYHPDAYGEYDALLQDLATKRSQDINSAYERMRTKRARRGTSG